MVSVEGLTEAVRMERWRECELLASAAFNSSSHEANGTCGCADTVASSLKAEKPPSANSSNGRTSAEGVDESDPTAASVVGE